MIYVIHNRPEELNKELKRRTQTKLDKNGNILKKIVKKVIFAKPKTIVLWRDGSKTIVTANKEKFDKEKGLLMAFYKRYGGGKNYYDDLVEIINNADDVSEKNANRV